MEIENKQEKAYNLYINGLSIKQIANKVALSKDVLKKLEKNQKWDKIRKKIQEYSIVYNFEGDFYHFMLWISINCRAYFLEIASLAMKYNKNDSFNEDDYLSLKLTELRNINAQLDEIYGLISLLYYSDKECFDHIYNDVLEFSTQIKQV